MSDPIDTGFGDVLAGEVYTHPDPSSVAEQITVTVNPEPPPCVNTTVPAAAPSLPSAASLNASSPSTSPTPATTVLAAPAAKSASALSPAGVQATKALIALPALTWPELSKLAMDVAMNIKQTHVILAEHKLTQTQYDFLEANNEFYRNALTEACRQWHAPLSTQERIKVEAAAILEDSLLGLGARMQNRAEGLPGVIEAAKLFAKVAGVGEPQGGAISSSERFVINIDLGGDQKISIGVGGEANPVPAVADVRAISTDGEGA